MRGTFAADTARHMNMNLVRLIEFGWEKNRTAEVVHFLSNPPPPLEWTGIYPTERQLKKLRIIPSTVNVTLKEVWYKKEKIYGFLSGI